MGTAYGSGGVTASRQAGGPVAAGALDGPLADGRIDLGKQAPKKLSEVGMKTYRGLLQYLPRRYEDRRVLPGLSSLEDGVNATVIGQVVSRIGKRSQRGLHVFRASLIADDGGRLTVVWFNQPWLEKQVFPGLRLIVTGKVKVAGRTTELVVAGHEVDDDTESLSFGRIVGVYPTTQGLSQAYLRRSQRRLLDALGAIPDHLQRSLVERYGLVSLDRAWRQAHFPDNEEELQAALRRLKFDDFLFVELAVMRSRDPLRLGRSFTVATGDVAEFMGRRPRSEERRVGKEV